MAKKNEKVHLAPAGYRFEVPGTVKAPAPPTVGIGRLRKIALVGTAPTVVLTPWDDPTWEVWAHASSRALCYRVTRYFDLHPRELWSRPKKWDTSYVTWLQRNPVPIYMQQRYAEVPASIEYPKSRVLMEFRRHFTSHVSWMIALALTEGVTHIGLFGVHYSSDAERTAQRSGTTYMLGVAEGRGVQLVIPEGNEILSWPPELYGYESHPDGKLCESYRWVPKGPTVEKAGKRLELTVLDDDLSKPRPPLRQDLLQSPAWERSGHPLPELTKDGFKYY